MEIWIVLAAVALIILLASEASSSKQDAATAKAKLAQMIARESSLTEIANEARSDRIAAQDARASAARDNQALENLLAEKTAGFPWLAQAWAEWRELEAERAADELRHKSHPAYKAAEKLREYGLGRRQEEAKRRILDHRLRYYCTLFPWLAEFDEADIDDQIISLSEGSPSDSDPEDPVRGFLSDAEYRALSQAERNQLALDRYWKTHRTKWRVGRDYERYIGYLYEREHWDVRYQGIIEGFADLGRDLIAKRGRDTRIIQCKCWSSAKSIHEKHVFQLFGTTVEFYLKQFHEAEPVKQLELFPELLQSHGIVGVVVTSTALSAEARRFARVLGISVVEQLPLVEYPCIKCNVSRRTGEKIYHLPMDQQYDSTIIEEERTECYVSKVSEAEALGFRRAFRWRGGSG